MKLFLDDNGKKFPKWEKVRLGEISKISTGFTPKTDDITLWNGDIPWLSIRGMDQGKYISQHNKTITSKALGKKEILPAGTLLMTFKLTLGKLAILKNAMFTNEAICNFRWKSDDIDTEFMYYALSTVDVASFGSRAVMGITLNSESLDSIVVPLPSLPEQQKIAEFFSALDERIALTADKVKLLKEQKQGYLQKIFNRELVFTDDNGNFYPEWEEKRKLSDISTVKRGASPRPIADKRWFSEKSDTGWVRISDVSSSGKYLLKTTQYLSSEGIEQSVKVEPGNLILSIAGSVGKPAITKVPVCIHDGFILFKDLTANAEYLYYFLENYRDKWKLLSQSGSQPNINSEIVGKLTIALPSFAEQEKTVEFFSALDEQIEINENKLTLLQEQKKGYLQGIFG